MDKSSMGKMYFDKKIVMIGFGSIGQAVLPLLFQEILRKPEQVIILNKTDQGFEIAQQFGVIFKKEAFTVNNYIEILNQYLESGDLLLNLSVGVSSQALITLCQEKEVLYLDTCTEPWEGGYILQPDAPRRTNYGLREEVLQLKKNNTPTAVITHGANPGLVSHFLKQALLNMADDNRLDFNIPNNALEWATLAQELEIKAIHIAERDTQVTTINKQPNEFINTWSVDGLIAEGMQPAELGWGTHERHWPEDGNHHTHGSKCAIYLDMPGVHMRVRTWTPNLGAAHGFLITHAESISLANYLTIENNESIVYRPTVHYSYVPCQDAVHSIQELVNNDGALPTRQKIICDEIVSGMDELGVLLMGNKRGAYWYGSQLSIEEAREKAPFNSATSLQVAAGVVAGVNWAIMHPRKGLVEPENMDYKYILNIARPYLGKMAGYYTDWNPLQDHTIVADDQRDHSDPWQFLNMRVRA